ncbi:MAG: DUF504 domain-containing protein [Candidatus Helarchaeota archaeon]
MPSQIQAILNRIRWDDQLKSVRSEISITYIHRGAKNDKKTIFYSEIEDILPAFFTMKNETLPDEKTNIPFHRILEIKNIKTGEVLYKKK